MSSTTSITVRVPLTIRRRGGRKLVVAPDGSLAWAPQRTRADNTLIKALARAHRWKRLLDDGRYGSVSELAVAEKLDRGYLGRILMLTLLAPDIVEAMMDGRQPAHLGVHVLREGFPVEWAEQRVHLQKYMDEAGAPSRPPFDDLPHAKPPFPVDNSTPNRRRDPERQEPREGPP